MIVSALFGLASRLVSVLLGPLSERRHDRLHRQRALVREVDERMRYWVEKIEKYPPNMLLDSREKDGMDDLVRRLEEQHLRAAARHVVSFRSALHRAMGKHEQTVREVLSLTESKARGRGALKTTWKDFRAEVRVLLDLPRRLT